METVMITGGTGLIGTALTPLLISKGYKVIVLTRRKRAPKDNVTYALWDIERSIIDEQALSDADHVVHLAGAGIADRRWTDKRKKQIIDSRVDSAKLLVKTLSENPNKVKTIVSASAIGWYGPDKKKGKPFTEDDPYSGDFLGTTCKLWQDSVLPAEQLGIRTVFLRTGIVLARQGGAFPEFIKPMKAGVATIFGDGKQVVSWIHIDDICRMYAAAIETKNMHGAYNAVAPETITNKELMLKIARARGKPFLPVHVPEFVLKMALGELSIEILKSASVDDSRVREAGFHFIFPTAEAAVNDLV